MIALTPAQYAAEMAQRARPITDRPLGGATADRRKLDAEASAIVGELLGHGDLWPGNKPPDTTGTDRQGCGTNAGWQTHKRDGTRVCEECRVAHNAYVAMIKRRRVAS